MSPSLFVDNGDDSDENTNLKEDENDTLEPRKNVNNENNDNDNNDDDNNEDKDDDTDDDNVDEDEIRVPWS